MTSCATPTPIAARRDSTGLVRGSRGVPTTVRVRQTVLADLRDEVAALSLEQDRLGTQLIRLSQNLRYAFGTERWDIVDHVAGRLDALGRSLIRRGEA